MRDRGDRLVGVGRGRVESVASSTRKEDPWLFDPASRRRAYAGTVRPGVTGSDRKRQESTGFVLHVSYEDGSGFCVSEIWETQEQHDEWFNENVVPNVPMAISQETIALHSIHQP